MFTKSNRKILPAVTTVTPGAWREKIEEAKNLGLEEIALFPTCLSLAQRKELYELLKTTGIKEIPFVHLRNDMTEREMAYLIENYGTQAFNCHTAREFAIPAEWLKYKSLIYIENTYEPFDGKEIEEFAGICLDFSHLENDRTFRPEIFEHNIKIIEKYPCGCNHVGPAKNFPFLNRDASETEGPHPHFMASLAEFDYLGRYPAKYFSPFLALESENSLKEQLKIKDYLTELLK